MKNGLTDAQLEEMKAMGVKFYESPKESTRRHLFEKILKLREEEK